MSIKIEKSAMFIGTYECHGKINDTLFVATGDTQVGALDRFFQKVYWFYPELANTKRNGTKKGFIGRLLELF